MESTTEQEDLHKQTVKQNLEVRSTKVHNLSENEGNMFLRRHVPACLYGSSDPGTTGRTLTLVLKMAAIIPVISFNEFY